MATNNSTNTSKPVSVAQGGTGAATLTSNAVLLGNGTAAISTATALTDGQLLIGSTGNAPAAATLTAGSGISIATGAGSITINATGQTAWNDVTGTTQTIAVNNGYAANNAGLVTFTLPAAAALGDVFEIYAKGAGGWTIAQNAGQSIQLGNVTTTAGAGGSLSSSDVGDYVLVRCVTANTGFAVMGSMGNITYV